MWNVDFSLQRPLPTPPPSRPQDVACSPGVLGHLVSPHLTLTTFPKDSVLISIIEVGEACSLMVGSLANTTPPFSTDTCSTASGDPKLIKIKKRKKSLCLRPLVLPKCRTLLPGNTSHPAPELVDGSTAWDVISGLISFYPGPSGHLAASTGLGPWGP